MVIKSTRHAALQDDVHYQMVFAGLAPYHMIDFRLGNWSRCQRVLNLDCTLGNLKLESAVS